MMRILMLMTWTGWQQKQRWEGPALACGMHWCISTTASHTGINLHGGGRGTNSCDGVTHACPVILGGWLVHVQALAELAQVKQLDPLWKSCGMFAKEGRERG